MWERPNHGNLSKISIFGLIANVMAHVCLETVNVLRLHHVFICGVAIAGFRDKVFFLVISLITERQAHQ